MPQLGSLCPIPIVLLVLVLLMAGVVGLLVLMLLMLRVLLLLRSHAFQLGHVQKVGCAQQVRLLQAPAVEVRKVTKIKVSQPPSAAAGIAHAPRHAWQCLPQAQTHPRLLRRRRSRHSVRTGRLLLLLLLRGVVVVRVLLLRQRRATVLPDGMRRQVRGTLLHVRRRPQPRRLPGGQMLQLARRALRLGPGG
jgi:hypothetical protein